jgi:hypothetical protein
LIYIRFGVAYWIPILNLLLNRQGDIKRHWRNSFSRQATDRVIDLLVVNCWGHPTQVDTPVSEFTRRKWAGDFPKVSWKTVVMCWTDRKPATEAICFSGR